MTLEKVSGCKINLLLNILGRREDGFHELETVIHPVGIFDRLIFARGGVGIELTCTDPRLPTDSQNLAHRAASRFMEAAHIRDGVRLHLEKNIPLAAGLGGGSGNAATTLVGLNELFGSPLSSQQLQTIAASLGSDVPFFLQHKPALATNRGEKVQPLESFSTFLQAWLVLVHPGFGISTKWAYQALGKFPAALNGKPGRAQDLISALQKDIEIAGTHFFNSLEAPALHKYPLLAMFQEFFRSNGAVGTLMSGSGSSTFALLPGKAAAEELCEKFKARFGSTHWLAIVPAASSMQFV